MWLNPRIQFFNQRSGLIFCSVLAAVISAAVTHAELHISEIMYHPLGDRLETEFIEIENSTTDDIDISGWEVDKGVSYIFPAGTNIKAGERIVLAADPQEVRSEYDVHTSIAVYGPWEGRLSNSGEEIRLLSADGEKIDSVKYFDEGAWAERVRISGGGLQGWQWNDFHDGDGRSLELINRRSDNSLGQNWTHSTTLPTPGLQNSVDRPTFRSVIVDVDHQPLFPSAAEATVVRCQVTQQGAPLAQTPQLHWRVATTESDEFEMIAMTVDTDGDYAAAIPPQESGSIIEFYISYTEGGSTVFYPAASAESQVASCLYQVGLSATRRPEIGKYHIVMTPWDREDFKNANPASSVPVNATAYLDDGSGLSCHYSSGLRLRGNSSRFFDPPSMNLELPSDNSWNDQKDLNLNTVEPERQILGALVMQAAGLMTQDIRGAEVVLNGVAVTVGEGRDVIAHARPLDIDFVEDRIKGEAGGALYKKKGSSGDNTWIFENGNVSNYQQNGWERDSDISEPFWSDLDTFLEVVTTDISSADYTQRVATVADLPQWYRFFAVMNLLASRETAINTGRVDDYFQFRPAAESRFQMIGRDYDSILLLGDEELTLFNHIEFRDAQEQLVALFGEQSVREAYVEEIQRLLDGLFSAEIFPRLVESAWGGWTSAAMRAEVIEIMNRRRVYAQTVVETELGARPSRQQPTLPESIPALASSAGLVLNEVSPTANKVEILNTSSSSVDLSGWAIAINDDDVETAFALPDVSVVSGDRFVFHIARSIGNNINVALRDPTNSQVDEVAIGRIPAGSTFSRIGAEWRLSQPTLGQENIVQPLGNVERLVISDFMIASSSTTRGNYVAVQNSAALPISISGLQVSDRPFDETRRQVLPQASYLAAGERLIFESEGSPFVGDDRVELSFSIGRADRWFELRGENGLIIDHVWLPLHEDGDAFVRDASGNFQRVNLPPVPEDVAATDGLAVASMMYHPLDDEPEFLRLRNTSPDALSLSDLIFTDGIEMSALEIIVAPSEEVAFSEDVDDYISIYGDAIPVVAEFSGKLSNGGERVTLENRVTRQKLIDFEYSDDWYAATDGDGAALVAVSQSANLSEASGWQARMVPRLQSYDDWAAENLAAMAGADDDPDNDGISNLWEYHLGSDPLATSQLADFSRVADGLLSLRQNAYSIGGKLTYSTSQDLIHWTDFAPINGLLEGEVERLRLDVSDEPRLFLQLQLKP